MNDQLPGRDLSKSPFFVERALTTLQHFLHVEAVSGVVLLAAAAAALLWANSPFAHTYHDVWDLPVRLRLGEFVFTRSLHFWINDALMTIFFLVVGMEIRREIHEGALSKFDQAMLPVLAAFGGAAVPALIYLSFNAAGGREHGWAIPTATDIAFAVGVLALLGKSIPGNVRVFLLALAIIDDIIAVLIIALFYTSGLDLNGFAVAVLGVLLALGFQRLGLGSAYAYIVPAFIVWAGFLMAGVHPTLAGVVLGLITPVRSASPEIVPPVIRVETALHPWVAYGIMPIFALANAGVSFTSMELAGGAQFVTLGVALALCAGKPIGVIGATWLAVRVGGCRLAPDVTWAGICLIGLLAGIGFTMSIFIAMLAFNDDKLLDAAKFGVLLGSLISVTLGLGWGAEYAQRRRKEIGD
ncbi:NhaA family Na+:H+ antiporter [Bradyrhizobium japonicum]|uniref:Na+/H+ antiporter NhaA n=1 Tax=Bradyrhizobium japonicum TaxID=375 RepID=UPI00216A0B28|nr:Na+/H+ antiporter NhaA [Bradyrhizobium japonicum]MCS3501953.1 NhaA family Na+:H+ antiporter [Bradyrhizobium japonicum]MCS3965333.1 NhaA family Na+:H+ antiporter [Bradyrhizobium japonicum]MCS3997640.1 NhaA family Na+:H+ antiporter [Bradyrhizobium japonicum]